MLIGDQTADVEVVAQVIRNAASSVVGRILSSEYVKGTGSVSFVEFGVWYNSTGHVVVPWIELLDTHKWPDVLSDGIPNEGDDDDDT